MKILITAFEPFGGNNINPSLEVLKAIPDSIDSISISKLIIPVSFKNAFKPIESEIKNSNYDLIIMLGQYGGASSIRMEMAGHNIISSTRPDNDGNIPSPHPIDAGAAYGYFTKLDLWNITTCIKNKGYNVDISESAGTYVCNFVYFSTLNYIYKNSLDTKALFVHLPYIKEQNKEPNMDLETEIEIITEIIKIINK